MHAGTENLSFADLYGIRVMGRFIFALADIQPYRRAYRYQLHHFHNVLPMMKTDDNLIKHLW